LFNPFHCRSDTDAFSKGKFEPGFSCIALPIAATSPRVLPRFRIKRPRLAFLPQSPLTHIPIPRISSPISAALRGPPIPLAPAPSPILAAKQSPRLMTFRQEVPVVAGMFNLTAPGFHQPPLQAGQRPVNYQPSHLSVIISKSPLPVSGYAAVPSFWVRCAILKDRPVVGDDDRAALVTARNELKEETGALAVDGQVISSTIRSWPLLSSFSLFSSGPSPCALPKVAMGDGGNKKGPSAMLASLKAQRYRQMAFAHPGGPRNRTLSLLCKRGRWPIPGSVWHRSKVGI
jgi:hypothetical protein